MVFFLEPINFFLSAHTFSGDDVIQWKHFPRNWPFVRGIHRSPVNSPHKGQWRGALMFYLICIWINAWVNKREGGDLRHHRAHYDVIVMWQAKYPCVRVLSLMDNDCCQFWSCSLFCVGVRCLHKIILPGGETSLPWYVSLQLSTGTQIGEVPGGETSPKYSIYVHLHICMFMCIGFCMSIWWFLDWITVKYQCNESSDIHSNIFGLYML